MDANHYSQIKSIPGDTSVDWLFLPGGPGADSSYMQSLIELLDMPGDYWTIDLPGNGQYIDEVSEDYDFDQWGEALLNAVKKFEKPILVGHSFGGMYPLLFPELENLLKGFVILNSTPSLWLEEAAKCAQENKLPSLNEPLGAFTNNPNSKTFKTALLACAPYYFPKENLEEGKQLLQEVPFNFRVAVWWLKKAYEINFNAKWSPQTIPALIVTATQDYICPYTLFENDTRFSGNNITHVKINQAGHFSWLDQPDRVKTAFNDFHKTSQST